jgi:hypothetical protein
MRLRPPLFAAAILAVGTACGPKGEDIEMKARGNGLRLASLSANRHASVYVAALRASFDLTPDLSLLVHPALLPREAGYEGGAAFPEGVRAVLRDRGIIRGACRPTPNGARRAPRCTADLPGYVVRFSEVFSRGGDTLQTHLLAERYDTPSTGPSSRLRFELAYQLTPNGDGWRVVREGRIKSAAEQQ